MLALCNFLFIQSCELCVDFQNEKFVTQQKEFAARWPECENSSSPRTTVFVSSLDYGKKARGLLRDVSRSYEASHLLEAVSALARGGADTVVIVASAPCLTVSESITHLLSTCAG